MKINPHVIVQWLTRVLLLKLVFAGIVFNACADEQKDIGRAKLSAVFQAHEQLDLRLEASFKQLFEKREEDRPYFPAVLSYRDAQDKEVRVPLSVRVRGHFRAKQKHCRYPPLKLNFNRKDVKGTIFDGENKLKLVTHCRNTATYEQYVLLEYMNYRIHNLLTEYSLVPRLAMIEYFDTDRQKVKATRAGFLIEDQKRMARRVGAKRIKVKRVEIAQYNQELLHLATVFAYLLGNTDFSLTSGPKGEDCCHNIIPLRRADGSLVPVAYDFDVTGIVNSPYAEPWKHLGIRSLRQRLYRGYCQDMSGFRRSFALFHEKREAIMELYEMDLGLKKKTVKSTLKYLDQFYDSISSDEKIASEFIGKCRQ